jgi:hypothetical protein
MIITFVQIALRELFELPMVGVEEFTRYLFIAAIFVGLPMHIVRMDTSDSKAFGILFQIRFSESLT